MICNLNNKNKNPFILSRLLHIEQAGITQGIYVKGWEYWGYLKKCIWHWSTIMPTPVPLTWDAALDSWLPTVQPKCPTYLFFLSPAFITHSLDRCTLLYSSFQLHALSCKTGQGEVLKPVILLVWNLKKATKSTILCGQ